MYISYFKVERHADGLGRCRRPKIFPFISVKEPELCDIDLKKFLTFKCQ